MSYLYRSNALVLQGKANVKKHPWQWKARYCIVNLNHRHSALAFPCGTRASGPYKKLIITNQKCKTFFSKVCLAYYMYIYLLFQGMGYIISKLLICSACARYYLLFWNCYSRIQVIPSTHCLFLCLCQVHLYDLIYLSWAMTFTEQYI